MRLQIICNYCDHKWSLNVYSKPNLKSIQCNKCMDKNIKMRDLNEAAVDYYIGCPEFPKITKDGDIVLDYYD